MQHAVTVSVQNLYQIPWLGRLVRFEPERLSLATPPHISTSFTRDNAPTQVKNSSRASSRLQSSVGPVLAPVGAAGLQEVEHRHEATHEPRTTRARRSSHVTDLFPQIPQGSPILQAVQNCTGDPETRPDIPSHGRNLQARPEPAPLRWLAPPLAPSKLAVDDLRWTELPKLHQVPAPP